LYYPREWIYNYIITIRIFVSQYPPKTSKSKLGSATGVLDSRLKFLGFHLPYLAPFPYKPNKRHGER
jgi:hypothetical protein